MRKNKEFPWQKPRENQNLGHANKKIQSTLVSIQIHTGKTVYKRMVVFQEEGKDQQYQRGLRAQVSWGLKNIHWIEQGDP